MSALDKVKAATSKLTPDEQVELFRWWVESDSFKARQITALKRDLELGVSQLDTGHYQTYNDSNLTQLAEDIGRAGRERLKKQGS